MGIKARMNKDKKYYRIRILKESTKKFLEIIKPYLHPSMFYKVAGLDPVETRRRKFS